MTALASKESSIHKLRTLSDLLNASPDLSGKNVLVRLDLNVPMQHGKVTDTTRMERTIPTIRALQKANATVVILSHFGRPRGEFNASMSLAPVADALGGILDEHIRFAVDCRGKLAKETVKETPAGAVVLLENLRFYIGETQNDPTFAKELAEMGDIYIDDAFSCAHRAHASIEGITHHLPSYAGFLMEEEIGNLRASLDDAEHPVAAIVGGSKISTKISLLKALTAKTDYLFVGGGMANTFMYAMGIDIGKSLVEKDKKDTALAIIEAAEENGCNIMIPKDVTLARELAANVSTRIDTADGVREDEMILDIGPRTLRAWSEALQECKTVVWNGPLGAFEYSPFNVGSIGLAREIALLTQQEQLMSVAGGGDVLAALKQAGLRESFSYISTAGGAFLEWLEGKELPGIKALMG